MTDLFLARHGNTFEASEPSRWIGAREDLPLTSEGLAQAARCAEALTRRRIIPVHVRAGELRRTRDFARTICGALRLPAPTFDPRLNELDYGAWSGRTSADIRKEFGDDVMRAWESRSIRPTAGGFLPSAESTVNEIRSLVSELHRDYDGQPVLLVTSNGRLRYFRLLALPEDEALRDASVRTGHLSHIRIGDQSSIEFWNRDPGTL